MDEEQIESDIENIRKELDEDKINSAYINVLLDNIEKELLKTPKQEET